MGVFSRFKDIVNSNINSMLDSAEDPEKMINLMIREMEDTIVELRSNCSEQIAKKSKLAKEKTEIERVKNRWEMRVNMAIEKGRDDLAKEALYEKRRISDQFETVLEEYNFLDKTIQENKINIDALETKLENIKKKKRILVERSLHAKEQKRANENLRKAESEDAMIRFEELENRIAKMEAEADLSKPHTSYEDEFVKMEAEADIDKELEALKKKIKKETSKNTEGEQ